MAEPLTHPRHTLTLIVQAGRLWRRLDTLSYCDVPPAYRARLLAVADRAAARWDRRERKYPPARWLDPVPDHYRDR